MSATRDTLLDLADEYVLGLLDPGETEAVELRIEVDLALRTAVGAARDRFLELDLAGEAALVSAGLWERIAAGLDSAVPAALPAASPSVTASSVAPSQAFTLASNDNRAERWRWRALTATAASLLLAAGLGWSLLFVPAPVVVAVLLDTAGEPLALVEDFGNASARVTPLVDFEVPDGRTMQLWTLPSADRGPVSLGLLARSETALLDGPDLPAPRPDQLYEITLEQAGGSPTGRPTGPILVKGFAKIPR